MANILCTGVHPGLVQTRKLIPQQATALSEAAIAAACRDIPFDAAAIGHIVLPSFASDFRKRRRTYDF
jgi:hypothetical protein